MCAGIMCAGIVAKGAARPEPALFPGHAEDAAGGEVRHGEQQQDRQP